MIFLFDRISTRPIIFLFIAVKSRTSNGVVYEGGEDPDFLILIKRTHSFDFDIWVLIMSFKTIFPLYRGR